MKTPRIKIDPEVAAGCYHCMTRTVNGEHLFDDTAKEVLRKQLWQTSDYCGIQIITYHLLANHLHIVLRVPKKVPLSDEELLRRFQVLHPSPSRYQSARLEGVKQQMAVNGPGAKAWRDRQLRMMGDLSPFMQLLKQRFSIWFNKTHSRYGTLWASRFKSVLAEGDSSALQTMAAYVDLNSVRAGLVTDPKDYRFSGYAEAIAGNLRAREGLASVFGCGSWEATQAAYRLILFGTGTEEREESAVISRADFRNVVAAGGRLSRHEVLRCRVRHFTDGAVLGSRIFVETQLAAYRERTGRGERTSPRPLPNFTDWGGLVTLRALRQPAIG